MEIRTTTHPSHRSGWGQRRCERPRRFEGSQPRRPRRRRCRRVCWRCRWRSILQDMFHHQSTKWRRSKSLLPHSVVLSCCCNLKYISSQKVLHFVMFKLFFNYNSYRMTVRQTKYDYFWNYVTLCLTRVVHSNVYAGLDVPK